MFTQTLRRFLSKKRSEPKERIEDDWKPSPNAYKRFGRIGSRSIPVAPLAHNDKEPPASLLNGVRASWKSVQHSLALSPNASQLSIHLYPAPTELQVEDTAPERESLDVDDEEAHRASGPAAVDAVNSILQREKETHQRFLDALKTVESIEAMPSLHSPTIKEMSSSNSHRVSRGRPASMSMSTIIPFTSANLDSIIGKRSRGMSDSINKEKRSSLISSRTVESAFAKRRRLIVEHPRDQKPTRLSDGGYTFTVHSQDVAEVSMMCQPHMSMVVMIADQEHLVELLPSDIATACDIGDTSTDVPPPGELFRYEVNGDMYPFRMLGTATWLPRVTGTVLSYLDIIHIQTELIHLNEALFGDDHQIPLRVPDAFIYPGKEIAGWLNGCVRVEFLLVTALSNNHMAFSLGPFFLPMLHITEPWLVPEIGKMFTAFHYGFECVLLVKNVRFDTHRPLFFEKANLRLEIYQREQEELET